uniref:2Fe-2S iron-sulfur cluster-binding protein n=1 Tax=Mangrovicoccus ximenensis TaxID=1911570 RepID=UPI000D346720|nr:2Fe-2S iron-sulfur cluster-binding protein [Mangrovicoccus ximenensis]
MTASASAASGRSISVGPQQSLLEALEAAAVPIESSCRGGACGRCETAVEKPRSRRCAGRRGPDRR